MRERLVAFGSVWVGAAHFSYATVAESAAERAAAGFPTAFTPLLFLRGLGPSSPCSAASLSDANGSGERAVSP